MNSTKFENICLERPESDYLLKMRQSVSSKSLKKVIIRFDFTGLSNLEAWISLIKVKFCADIFSDYSFGSFSCPSYDINVICELAELLDIPAKDLTDMKMHVFSHGKIEGYSDNLTLSISKVSVELQVDCNNYSSIDPYTNFMIDLMGSLFKADQFVALKRFSIRKTDGFMYRNMEDVETNLESRLFFNETIKLPVGYESHYIDRFECKAFCLKVNNSRLFRFAKRYGSDIYQAILDIEAYADNQIRDFRTKSDNFDKWLKDMATDLNDCLFNMFLNSVTPKYIKDNAKQ